MFVIAVVVDALAPSFTAQRNRVQALKTVAYSFTARWVASIIGVVPGLGFISALLGVVSVIVNWLVGMVAYGGMHAAGLTR